MIPANTVIYASDDSPESEHDAKQFARDNNLTPDQARLVRKNRSILLILRTPWHDQ